MSFPLSLILPDIRSCHNVGAMFRTADVCGFDMLYLVGYTAHPPKVQIDKVSLGAETWVPWTAETDLCALIARLQSQGTYVVALEKTARSQVLEDWAAARPWAGRQGLALIVGNEVDGVSEAALAQCDAVVHIPMYGKKESLNVSIAAGIALYMIAQHTRKQA